MGAGVRNLKSQISRSEKGTEIPKPSSQIDNNIETCKTPTALTDSQNSPSAQPALPIVPNAISFPFVENSDAPVWKVIHPPVELGRVRQAHKPRHLGGRGRQIGRAVVPACLGLEAAVGVKKAGCEMARHLSTARCRFGHDIGMGVEFGKEFFDRHQIQSQHQRLVPVIAGPEIALPERVGHGKLGRFLAVAENAELGLSRKHLATTKNAELPAPDPDAVVAQYGVGIPSTGFGFILRKDLSAASCWIPEILDLV